MKLSSKIVTIFLFVLMGTIIVMGFTFYIQAKNFYKDQLTRQLEHRLVTHADSISSHFQMETIVHVLKMERGDTVNFILFDEDLIPLVIPQDAEAAVIEGYQFWISEQIQAGLNEHGNPITNYIETLDRHIPHIWSVQPIFVQDRIKGYLFIDQDTREFSVTQKGIIKLVLIMSIIISIVSMFLLLYLSKVLTRPLKEMGQMTNHIARGNFNTVVKTKGNDEVAELGRHIQEMANQLKRYHDTRKEFLSHISHDLRTPLTYVKGYASLLKDSKTVKEEDCKKHAEIIHRQATRMELLVQDLFQLAKLEEGSIELEYQHITIFPWLRDIEESYSYKLIEEQIELSIKCDPKDIVGYFDKKRMEQVLVNLLENSIRYTGVNGEISILVKIEKNKLIFELSDTGQGIPKEDLPFIFERFYRVDKARTSNRGGSGLGLSIVKQIVNLHRGEIRVHSKEGQGTTFTIELPKEKL